MALALLVTLGAGVTWAPRQPVPVPPRVPAATAREWMADALPTVGAKRRAVAAEAIRAGRIGDLPVGARTPAMEAFVLDGAAAGSR